MEIIDIKKLAIEAINNASNEQELNEVRNNHLSKKAPINLKMGEIRNIPNEEKKAFGEAINNARNEILAAFEAKKEELKASMTTLTDRQADLETSKEKQEAKKKEVAENAARLAELEVKEAELNEKINRNKTVKMQSITVLSPKMPKAAPVLTV